MMIYKRFSFDSAHFLPRVPEGHKCKNIHGHTYSVTVFIEGDLNDGEGWVIDYTELKRHIQPVIDLVDHQLLNDVPGLENPTAEMLAKWFWSRIKPAFPGLKKIEINETPSSGVIYEGN